MAPDLAVPRNEQAEGGKPITIDEMLENHRGRVDRMLDIVHALGRRRIDAERMKLRPVLAGLDDRALRHWRREAALEGDARQLGLVDRDRHARAGPGQHRRSQTLPEIVPRLAHCLAPVDVDRPADAYASRVLDAVGNG